MIVDLVLVYACWAGVAVCLFAAAALALAIFFDLES